MRVTFVLPFVAYAPVGGVKMVYEFANHLQRRGHHVTVVHAVSDWYKSRLSLGRLIRTCSNNWALRSRIPWFPVHPQVRLLAVPSLDQRYIPTGDVVVATAWETAAPVASYGPDKGRPFYLIQHYETWAGPKDRVDATWTLPLQKIVIARWLWDIGVSWGETERMTYIPYGLDHSVFRITQPVEQRDPSRIAMLYHTHDWKGAADGIAALNLARHHISTLRPHLFGTTERPPGLPDWIDYTQQPTPEAHRDLYNSCAMFLHTSWTEGFGLTSIEAMACGCALIATANDGVRDYAFDEHTALLTPIKDPSTLAQTIVRLVHDAELRRRLAITGNQYVQHYQWGYSAQRMERTFLGQITDRGPDTLINRWLQNEGDVSASPTSL